MNKQFSNYVSSAIEQFLSWSTNTKFRPIVILLSIFTATFFLRLWQYGWAVNDDGVMYLYAAKNFLEGGLPATLEAHPWALYSVIIAWVDQWLVHDLIHSAWLINYLFQLGQIYFLYKVLQFFISDKKILFFILVMFIISISFHNFRSYIVRDQGFYLCFIAGIYSSLLYLKSGQYKFYAGLLISLLLAAAFRIEALIILAACLISISWLRHDFKPLFSLLIVSVISIPILVSIIGYEAISDRFGPMISQVLNLTELFAERGALLEQYVLPKYWHDYSLSAQFFMYLGSFPIYLISAISIYLLCIFYVRFSFDTPEKKFILVIAITIIFYCLVFLLGQGFLVFRYNQPLTFMATVFALYWLYIALIERRRYASLILILILTVCLVKVLEMPSGSKRYLIEAQNVVKEMGLSGKEVRSNSLLVSLLNDIDYKSAQKIKTEITNQKSPVSHALSTTSAVVIYGRVEDKINLSEKNCLVYFNRYRKRVVYAVTEKNAYCLDPQPTIRNKN